MEEITMELLLKDFKYVVDEFNKLVVNKDIEGVKKALSEIRELIENNQEVELDHPEHPNADHVLHDLLKNIGGYIEREIIGEGKEVTSVEILEIFREWYEELEIEETLIIREMNSIRRTQIGVNEPVIEENDQNREIREELERLEREELDDVTRRNKIRELRQKITEIEGQGTNLSGQTSNKNEELRRELEQLRASSISGRIERIKAEIARRNEAWESTLQFTEHAEERKEEYDRGTDRLEEELAKLEKQIDDSGEKRIEELKAEIARRNEAWESTLQFTENAEERKEEYDRGTDRLEEQLAKLEKEQKEQEEAKEQERKIQARINEIEQELSKSPEKRIEELKVEIARRNEAWESTLQFTEHAEERKEEYDRETARLEAELAKLEKEQQISNHETGDVESLKAELERLESETLESKIAALQREIARRNEAWESTLQFTENAEERKEEYDIGTAKLEEQLAELEKQLEEKAARRERITALREQLDGPKATNIDKERIIRELEYQKRKLAKARALYDEFKNPNEYTPEDNDPRRMDSVKQRVHEGNLKREIEEIQALIDQLEEQLKNAEDRPDGIEFEIDIDEEIDDERWIILQTRLKAIRETKERLTVLSVQKTTIPGETTIEEFDVTEAVNEIGDKIFKTAAIREELARRDITREEFLEFYVQGRLTAEINITKLSKEREEIQKALSELVIDDQGIDLYKEMENAFTDNKDSEFISKAEELRKRSLSLGYPENIPESEITTKEDAEKLYAIIKSVVDKSVQGFTELSEAIYDQQENIEIFDREIAILEKEIETEKTSVEELSEDAEREKQLRNSVIEATMFGNNPELIEEWNERISRLYSHRKKVTETYIDENGEEKEIEFETIEEYPEYEEDIHFLNLSKYKQYLELSTKYENSNGDIHALGKDAIKYIELVKTKGGDPKEFFDGLVKEWKEYVETFHGFTNDYQIKYENLRTSGSTLKGMIPVKNLTPVAKTKAVAENVFRFFGIRKPEFTKIDQNGIEVKDIRGGLTTLGIDTLVVGAVGSAAIFGGVPAITTIGIGYAAKGIVTAGNMIRGAVYKRKYKDEIEAGVPILRGATEEEKMVARKDYYKTVEERSAISSWARAWNDRIFKRKRADETEEKITDRRKQESDVYVDEKKEDELEIYEENKQKSVQNQERRVSNFREELRSAYTYNSIISDPDAIDLSDTTSRIAQNAATMTYGGHRTNINPNSSQPRGNKYVKPEGEYLQTEELEDVEIDGDSIATTAITVEEHFTAEMQRRDRINKIWTMILTTAGKLGIDAIKGLTKEIELPDQEVRTVKKVPVYKDEVVDTKMPDTMGDFEIKADGLDNTYTGDTTGIAGDVISTGNSNTMLDPGAVSIQYTDASGNDIVMSMAEEGLGYTTKHVHALGNFDLSSMSPTEMIAEFAKQDPINYQNMIQAMGLDGKTEAEIAKIFIEKGMIHLQDKAMSGWQQITENNLTDITRSIFDGYRDEIVTQVIDGGTKTVVDPGKVVVSVAAGIGTGAAINLVDAAHEANKQTKKRRPGTYEQIISSYRPKTKKVEDKEEEMTK